VEDQQDELPNAKHCNNKVPGPARNQLARKLKREAAARKERFQAMGSELDQKQKHMPKWNAGVVASSFMKARAGIET
jgi:hypothetical protein